jgi:hypothetical protein
MRLPNLSPGVERRSFSNRREPGLGPSTVMIMEWVNTTNPVCTGSCSSTQPCDPGCQCNATGKCERKPSSG